jgi:uncharacterized membrane protein
MRIVSMGHAFFAAVMIALGIQGLLTGNFTAVWQPVPKGVPAREVLVYFCAVVSLGSGVGLLWRRSAAAAAGVLLASLLVWFMAFRAPPILRAPAAFLPWDGAAETALMVAAAWVLFAWFAGEWDRRHLGFATGERGVRVARMLYGACLVPFGMAHLLFIQATAGLVPGWIPAHVAWACLTGGAFLAAGAAVLTGVWARLAAALSALQIGLFTLLVWVPIVAGGSKDASQWSEFVLSTALTAAAWVVADSYRDMPWLGVGRR